MTHFTLPKVDDDDNIIPDLSPPTVEELRQDIINGRRGLTLNRDPDDGPVNIETFHEILAKDAETDVGVALWMEYFGDGPVPKMN
jgi:hypothetical protein